MKTYKKFREQYETQHPASIPVLEKDTEEYPSWLLPTTALMFVSISIVSGAHTTSTIHTTLEASLLPESWKPYIALFAFFGFELALFVSVFSWLRSRNAFISYTSTAVVFLVIVLANIQDVARSLSFADWFSSVITIGVGVGTPLVALLSGKIFVDVYRSNRGSKRKAQLEYNEAKKAWDATINDAYEIEQDKTDKTVSTDKTMSTDRQIRQTTQTSRKSFAVQNAVKYLRDNPDHALKSVREIGILADVGKDSAAKAKHIISNGVRDD